MINVYIGSEFRNEAPTDCRVLYVDAKRHFLWLWRPKREGGYGNYLAFLSPTGEAVRLGSLSAITDGCLALYRLNKDEFSKLKATDVETLANEPSAPIPQSVPLKQSLHTYIQAASGDADFEILNSIAWYVSSRLSPTENNLEHLSSTLTLADVARDQRTHTQPFIPRDQLLFDELTQTIEARRLVFVLGGIKSGLGEFIKQFTSLIVAQDPSGAHTADFNPSHFHDAHKFLASMDKSGLMGRLGADLETASVFASLGYGAYQSLFNASDTDHATLSAFIPHNANKYIEDFAFRYMAEFSEFVRRRTPTDFGNSGCQVESFLIFIGKLIEAAGRKDKLTVVLSFPGLTDWLREIRGQDVAEHTSRSLWAELRAFTANNYDAMSGQPKPGSVMHGYGYDVGILVEIEHLPLSEISEAFCRQSVLVMPPYSVEELSELWKRQMRETPSRRLLNDLILQTAGAPWFVDLLLECFKAAPAPPVGTDDATEKRLQGAIRLARIISASESPVPSLEKQQATWKRYVELLQSRMSPASLTDRKTLLNLIQAADVQKKIPKNTQAAEWLETGLIWLKNPDRKHSLAAFEKYPWVRTSPRAELIDAFINYLLQPKLHEAAV